MGKIIAVISGKEGVGKTTVAASISSCLATLNKKTLCLYFGAGSQSTKFALGMIDNVNPGNINVLDGQGGVIKACTELPQTPGLYILSLHSFIDLDKSDITSIKTMFSEIRNYFDYCIIDTPPVTDDSFKLALADADMSIIVTICDSPSITDVLIVGRHSIESGVRDFRLIINRILQENSEHMKASADKICDVISAKLIGLIPDEELVSQIPLSKNPLVLHRKRIFKSRFLSIARGIASEVDNMKKEEAAALEEIEQPPQPPLLTYERPQTTDDENISVDVPKNLLGKFGDPSLWAQSTLKNAKTEDLVAIYSVQANPLLSGDSIRNRMWLHDLLDDKKIPYYIEVGSKDGTKDLTEAQYIYVEKKNANKAIFFIKQYNDPSNIIRENTAQDDPPTVSKDGIPQKICKACGREIDFDYHKCPYCKESA